MKIPSKSQVSTTLREPVSKSQASALFREPNRHPLKLQRLSPQLLGILIWKTLKQSLLRKREMLMQHKITLNLGLTTIYRAVPTTLPKPKQIITATKPRIRILRKILLHNHRRCRGKKEICLLHPKQVALDLNLKDPSPVLNAKKNVPLKLA